MTLFNFFHPLKLLPNLLFLGFSINSHAAEELNHNGTKTETKSFKTPTSSEPEALGAVSDRPGISSQDLEKKPFIDILTTLCQKNSELVFGGEFAKLMEQVSGVLREQKSSDSASLAAVMTGNGAAPAMIASSGSKRDQLGELISHSDNKVRYYLQNIKPFDKDDPKLSFNEFIKRQGNRELVDSTNGNLNVEFKRETLLGSRPSVLMKLGDTYVRIHYDRISEKPLKLKFRSAEKLVLGKNQQVSTLEYQKGQPICER